MYGEVRIIRRMEINGQPAGIAVRTPSGEAYSSKAVNVVQNIIKPSIDTGQVTYDAARMWHSDKCAAHWVSLELLFPFPVELTELEFIHSKAASTMQRRRSRSLPVQTGRNISL
jgi:hypothetical protein